MAENRQQRHEIEMEASAETVFRLLHTPSAIRGWWGVTSAIVAAEQGGVWVATWGPSEDDPDYVTVATISAFDPPRHFALRYDRYFARTGPLPFEADFVVDFLIEPRPGGVKLAVVHSGFPMGPEADPFYSGVDAGWRTTLRAIKAYVEG